MSSKLVLPHVGHLQEVLHIVSYIKAYTNSKLVLNSSENVFDKYEFPRQDVTYSIYHIDESKIKEVLLPDMPKPSGKVINM